MINPLRSFSLMLEAMAELQPEIDAAQTNPSPSNPLANLGPLPDQAILLGLAPDGLPVLLNLHDPYPGPLLVAADPGAGKTALLQLIAQAASHFHDPDQVQFGVLTHFPDEWGHLTELEHCLGVFPTLHHSTIDFIRSLSSWAHANKGTAQSILLLVDDLERLEQIDFDARQSLRWLLLRGPSRRVWPLISINAQRTPQIEPWLHAFRTRIFGRIQDDRIAEDLSGIPASSLNDLQAGLQFALRDGNHWLKFQIPDGV